MKNYSSYEKYVNFIKRYRTASNAASGSQFDANANVSNKNIATLQGELPKGDIIGTNRLLMIEKLREMYPEEQLDEKYIEDLDNHIIYKHDETSIRPYCVSVSMYPFLNKGMAFIGGASKAPKHLDSFCGEFINFVFAVASQFAGAVSTPEFLTYLDYFIRKDFGDDYYKNPDTVVYQTETTTKTIGKIIQDKFEQVVHSMNIPAAARDCQSVFWNIAYFDKNYFDGIFGEFLFPDETEPKWDSVNWLQKFFMKWFNKERTRSELTFPVETVNLLNDGTTPVDQEWYDFTAEMYAEGHSFFTYTSNSVDSLASCCFDGRQMTLTKSSDGINYMSFEELYNAPHEDTKRNFTIFHNGSWVKGKLIKLPARPMYKVTTVNNKTLLVTDNHLHPTTHGDIPTSDLTTDDYLLFNCLPLDTYPERDLHLTYEQGFLIGMYLGDGSMYNNSNCNSCTISLSLNESKYNASIGILRKALADCGVEADIRLGRQYNNVYPVSIYSTELRDFIQTYVHGYYANEKELDLSVLQQSKRFRKGILDGYYLTDGGNSNRIYTTSEKLIDSIEVLLTSLGLISIIDVVDRTDEKIVIRGEEYNRNFPTRCIRWYSPKNRRGIQSNLWIIKGKLKLTNTEIARLLGVSESTVSNRFKHPETLTLREINVLCRESKIDIGKFVSENLSVS